MPRIYARIRHIFEGDIVDFALTDIIARMKVRIVP
jgi:hypothetical protein